MTIEPFARLADLYDSEEWGGFSLKYVGIIKDLSLRFGFTPRRILDISCGTGVLVRELMKDYVAIGSDLSPDMIAVAKKNCPAGTFYVSDMAGLDTPERFDTILSPFDSLNYLVDPGHCAVAFANIHRLLAPDGHFLFDFNSDRMYEEKHRGSFERKSGGVCFTQTCEYDPKTRIAKTIFDFGGGFAEVHVQRAYGLTEMSDILKKQNFHIQYSVEMSTKAVASDSSHKVLVLAMRK